MSDLREKIFKVLNNVRTRVYYNDSDLIYATGEILSLIDSSPVEGLEVVRKCGKCGGKGYNHEPLVIDTACDYCITGEIVRQMTRGEIEKAFKERIELEGVIELPSGERVRMKP